ncbi:MAG: Sua5/YciO/YrdC/YwlC family protein [Bacteroidales bacterium]|nr:Sua5/YciO/YrdC/YwlC family protein [Bacteroidales bacterium]
MEIQKALEVLRKGGIILYPTDTVWGIGCDATDPSAVAKVYEIKKRADSKSLVLLASDMDMICRYVKEVPEMAIQLVEVNDKPMTIIYPGAVVGPSPVVSSPSPAVASPSPAVAGPASVISGPSSVISSEVEKSPQALPKADRHCLAFNTVAEDGTVGIRIPMMDFCQQLVAKFGRPIVSTSANISGEPTPKKFSEISPEIRDAVDHIVDPSLERGSTGRSSSIIKVGLDYSIEIIRK